MSDLRSVPQHVDPGPRITAIEEHIKRNLKHCRDCPTSCFFVKNHNGKTLFMELSPSDTGTHELVPTSKDGEYTGEVTALYNPGGQRARYSVHRCGRRT